MAIEGDYTRVLLLALKAGTILAGFLLLDWGWEIAERPRRRFLGWLILGLSVVVTSFGVFWAWGVWSPF